MLLLGGYALFQVALWALVMPAPLPRPVRGSPAPACASSSFTQEGTAHRIALFDTSPLMDSPGSALPYRSAPNHGEEVFRQLSLLRESTRDGWIHFSGDEALKATWFEFLGLMQRQGLSIPLSARDAKKRQKQRHSKADARIGSTRLSYTYAPLFADLSKDWSKGAIWKAPLPPSLVIYSAGLWDAVNHTKGAGSHVDTLVATIYEQMEERIKAGGRVPTVVFLGAPALAESTSPKGMSLPAAEAMERQETLMEQLRVSVNAAGTKLATLEASAPAASTADTAPTQPERRRLVFVDIQPLSSVVSGRLPGLEDDGLHILLNPPATAVSLAAFTSCHLGQPVWALAAFTPGQIALVLIWIGLVALWMLAQLKLRAPSLFSTSAFGSTKYHRVGSSDADEIELGQAGGAGGASSAGGPNLSSPPPAASSSASGALLSYFSSSAWSSVLSCLVQLGCVLGFMFLLDGNHRLTWWIVGDKLYVRDTFLFLLLVLFIAAWRSAGTTGTAFPDKTVGAAAGAIDAPFLNRDQTEEWKGVMQILFVLYHYFAAKEMYNSIRVFIAAYVWMTGYGNFFFFHRMNDYSFARLTKMLFRLNFFVALVCIALDREFMQYYVCALHTFYFLAVYVTMGVAWQWNKNDRLLLVKFAVLFGVLFLLFDWPALGLFQKIFQPFSLFYWNNSLHEWWFRSSLDHYATALGMLCAWNVKRLEDFLAKLEAVQPPSRKLALQVCVAVGATVLGGLWMVYCLWLPKAEYNAQHPYTSIIPISLYILLRNLTPGLRSTVWFFFGWFGKITLETYILQFHIWLSDDAGTILQYFPNYPMCNWVFATGIYVAISLLMFQSGSHARTCRAHESGASGLVERFSHR